jgi:hypothetical protein
MSVVYIHVGQAGNQIGQELWQLLLHETGSIHEDIFFDRNRKKARAILVDTEPKVIKQILQNKLIEPLIS